MQQRTYKKKWMKVEIFFLKGNYLVIANVAFYSEKGMRRLEQRRLF